jgi:hypothetical protein
MWLAYWCGKVGMWLSFEANLTSGNSTNARVLLKTHNLNIWCHSSCRAIVYCGIFWAHFCPHNVKIFRSLSGIIFCCYGTRWAHKHKRQIASEKQCAPSAKISNHLLHSPNCRIYMLCALTSLSYFPALEPIAKKYLFQFCTSSYLSSSARCNKSSSLGSLGSINFNSGVWAPAALCVAYIYKRTRTFNPFGPAGVITRRASTSFHPSLAA